jgi:hypothetical protein
VRRLTRVGAIVSIVVVSAAAVRASRDDRPVPPSAANDVNVATTHVERTDLVATEQVIGALGYAASPPVVDHLLGTYTAMPEEGSVVRPGDTLFAVDSEPAVLMRGTVPAWRNFTPGMTDGVDVAELQLGLASSGVAPHLVIDGHYRWATIAAVRAWRVAHGLIADDGLQFGSVVFLPGAVRVGEHASEVGDAAQPGRAPYIATGPARSVAIELDVARRGVVRTGQSVAIELPSGHTIAGHVSSVGRVAHLPSDASASNARPAVAVTVTPATSAAIEEVDQTPVAVDIVTDRRTDVLAVPITALLARPGGGFGVEIVEPRGPRRLVAVTPGLFSDTMVEVAGAGVVAGMTVVTAR